MYGMAATTEFSGGGDPQRSLDLLWGTSTRPRRGPKPKLTAQRIAAVAIEIADAEGLTGLSMRRVATAVGVAPMSLYTYLPSKAELIDLMVDTALAELPPPEGTTWRERLTSVAHQNWALYHRHPWLLHISTHRPALGPNLIARYDAELRAVDGIGLSEVEMDSVLTMLTGFVQGTARASVDAKEVERRTGITDEQWWNAHAPLLERVLDEDRYPLAARVGAAVGEAYRAASAPEHAFAFGLERILDGIEVLVKARLA